MKILLAKHRAMGDTILLSSTVELLKKQFPSCEIHAWVPPLFAPLLLGNPGLAKVYGETPILKLIREIRAEKYDYFLHLHSSPGQRLIRWFSGAKKSFEHRQNKETELAYGKHPNALEWDRFFLAKLFPEVSFPPAPIPKIHLTIDEKKWGENFWRNRGADPKKIVFLGAGASRSTKRWSSSSFARFAELIQERLGLIPAVIHGTGEQEALFAGEVLDQLRVKGFRPQNMPGEKGGVVFAAGLSVRELASALSAVCAYVGNDSGPKHIAVAVGIPTFTFFGPEDPEEWHPYSRDTHPVFFIPALACRKEDQGRWCGIPVCIQEKHRCMRDIDPLDVLEVFRKRLKV